MELPVWLLWCISFLIATMPLVILPIAMKVDKVRPTKRRAKPVEFTTLVACDGFIVMELDDEELLGLARILAAEQMRIHWGKDIDCIY